MDALEYATGGQRVSGGGFGNGGGPGAAGTGGAAGAGGSITTSEGGAGGPSPQWWDDDFSRRMRITFANAARAEALLDFAVPVLLTPSQVVSLGAQPAGQDVRFVDADGQTELAHEIERWDVAQGACLWVRVPVIDATSDADFIWLYAGDGSAPDGQTPPAVWAGQYLGVWHLNDEAVDEGDGVLHVDSTGRGSDGTQHGNGRIVVDGASLAGGQAFDGVDDYIEIPTAGLQVAGPSLTVQARVRLDGQPNDFPHVLGAGADGRYWQVYWIGSGTPEAVGWASRLRAAGAGVVVASGAGALGQWASLAVTYDGAATTVYVDGQAVLASEQTGTLDPLTTAIRIGDNPVVAPRSFFGVIDEVRISELTRSAQWLSAEHDAERGALAVAGVVQQR